MPELVKISQGMTTGAKIASLLRQNDVVVLTYYQSYHCILCRFGSDNDLHNLTELCISKYLKHTHTSWHVHSYVFIYDIIATKGNSSCGIFIRLYYHQFVSPGEKSGNWSFVWGESIAHSACMFSGYLKRHAARVTSLQYVKKYASLGKVLLGMTLRFRIIIGN